MQQKVSIGPTTAFGGTVTVAAFATAIVAFANGARDAETFSALGVGALSMLATLGGRYGQAIAQVLSSYGTGVERPPADPQVIDYGGGFTQTGTTPSAKSRSRKKT